MSVYIPVDVQRRILGHFSECCAYCRTAEFLTAMTFEFEHIIPTSRGGDTVFENLCLACPSCNRHKASRITGDDPQNGQKVKLFHPHQQIWQEHFAGEDNYAELIGLTDTGRVTILTLMMNRPALKRARVMWVKLNEHPPQLLTDFNT